MTDLEHGTRNGWHRHLRAGEPACPPCLRANREYMRAWRSANTPTRKTTVPTELLVQLLAAAPPSLLDKAVQEFGRPVLQVWGLLPEGPTR